MVFHKYRFTTGTVGAVLLAAALNMNVYAVEPDRILPAAGIGLSLEEGVSMKKVVEEKGVSANATGVKIVDPVQTSKIVRSEIVEEVKTDYSNLVIAQVNDYVNVRSLPSEEGEIVGKLYNNSVGDFIEEVDGWYKIRSGNCIGYVKGEYCVTGEEANELAGDIARRVATVTTQTLNVRKEADLDSSILGQVPEGEVLTVTDDLKEWVQVKIEAGHGYVSKEYVTLSTEFTEAESKEEEAKRLEEEERQRSEAREASRRAALEQAHAATPDDVQPVVESNKGTSYDSVAMGQQVADFAVQFIGNPYVYGGTSLTNGADCSGFVMSVYANFGVSLPHSANADRKKGTAVASIEEAIPGDIVCYSGHVGIYIGNGQIVHASNSRTGIIISDANYDRILGVRRIF